MYKVIETPENGYEPQSNWTSFVSTEALIELDSNITGTVAQAVLIKSDEMYEAPRYLATAFVRALQNVHGESQLYLL